MAADCLQAVDQLTGGGLEGGEQGVHHLGTGEDVALAGASLAGPAAGPLVALGSGVGGGRAVAVHHSDLAVLSALVVPGQGLDLEHDVYLTHRSVLMNMF